ncbi:MAG: hypothetical protein ACTSXC_05245 [Candidatus Freyarchaeota archaeon]
MKACRFRQVGRFDILSVAIRLSPEDTDLLLSMLKRARMASAGVSIVFKGWVGSVDHAPELREMKFTAFSRTAGRSLVSTIPMRGVKSRYSRVEVYIEDGQAAKLAGLFSKAGKRVYNLPGQRLLRGDYER